MKSTREQIKSQENLISAYYKSLYKQEDKINLLRKSKEEKLTKLKKTTRQRKPSLKKKKKN
jgi:hypothetical protein